MDLVSLRIITDDLERLIDFYERVTGVAGVRYSPVFAELIFPSFTLAIGHTQDDPALRRGFRASSRKPHGHHRIQGR